MPEPTMQEILNRLFENLKSGDSALQLDGLRELGEIHFSSEAVIRQVEKLALGENEAVRAAALAALKLKTSKLVTAKKSIENRFNRLLVVKEIGKWEADGLIESYRAEIIRRRYDFDSQPEEPELQSSPVAREAVEPAAATESVPAPRAPAVVPAPPAPRPSLTQVLLSETSVKIYLYLGAFFVVAAAAILAALVEAARLPVLLAATALFAAGAVGLKKRLPQPSFALAIVFSFLLPIDANVIAEQLSLPPLGNEVYWTLVFILMAIIWALGTRFYASRLFSVVAFLSLALAALRFSEIFDASTDWNVLSVSVAALLGLLGVRFLRSWKDNAFAQPLFSSAQLLQLILLAVSLGSMGIKLLDSAHASGDWIASALTWILAASFYAASDILLPFPLFPWMAAASLFPLPWLVLSAFNAQEPALALGYGLSGALAAFASEFVLRFGAPIQSQETLESTAHNRFAKYHHPLLVLSLPMFVTSIAFGFEREVSGGFAAFLGAGLAYTIVHALRPRWYVWMTALVAGLGAYFTFFALPSVENLNLDFTYQALGASLFLLVPELFFKGAFSFQRSWSWPPVLLGTFLVGLNILIVLIEDNSGRSSLVFGVSALLFAAYALRYKEPLIGYLATTFTALTVVFALQHYERDWWLPALTALSVLYYAAGFFLARRDETKPWGSMLIASGLALGGLISALALAFEETNGGWYALVIAALFIVEMYARKNGWLEIFAEAALSIALILLLNDFGATAYSYYLFGLSLLWFTCDIVFKLTHQNRRLELPAKIIGAILTLASALFIAVELDTSSAAACFGIYTLFFAVYAWLHKNPIFGYASTLALALTVYFGLSAMNVDDWLFPQIAVATIYYAAGFILRSAGKAKGWDSTLLFSGLGLGTFVALLAPSQTGGMEKSIPIAIAATFYAAEAFARKNVWLGFPANALYLMSYFVILGELNVDEPQFYSVGAAALGLLQHYLFRRAGQKSAAFLMGIVSQLVLLGTSYIQMVDTGELKYFFLLLFQFLAMLAYGIVVRSRSLIIAPIAIVVIATLTLLYNALKDLSLVIIIGVTGIILLSLGILAVVMRERITNLAERFGDWDA